MQLIQRFGVIVVIASAVGCSFESQWNALDGKAAQGITGRWAGRWESKTNGHEGDLKAIVAATDQPHVYDVWYKASWAVALSGDFRVTMYGEPALENGTPRVNFTGSKDLGTLMGGVFQYRGWASDDAFYSTYTSEGDQGIFHMTRPR